MLSGTDTYGGATIAAGTLDLGKLSSAGGGAITFAGTQATPATLMLETAAQPGSGATFRNALTNFGANDELDLKGFTYSAADTVTLVGKTLTFTDKSNDASSGKTEKFTLAGTPGTAITRTTPAPTACASTPSASPAGRASASCAKGARATLRWRTSWSAIAW